ncbi:MAG: SOS response-associated peptidase, partial [Planctomycetes bacterium]|nr:SOS response-associated peptidase [Planctomycetota bacterium]
EGSALETCTIITTAANHVTRPYHDRMPVILAPEDYALWLDPRVEDKEQLLPLLRSYDATEILISPVGIRVNSPKHDDAECVEILADA